jgi:hypothetical protein
MISGSTDSVVARLAGSVWTGSSAVLFLPGDHFAAVVSTNLASSSRTRCSIRSPGSGGIGNDQYARGAATVLATGWIDRSAAASSLPST